MKLRPRISTAIKKKNFIKLLRKNLGVLTPTISTIDIHHQTYYNWMEKDEKFKAEVDLVKEIALDFVESQLFKAISNGNSLLIKFYMKTKGKHRGYIERIEQDVKGSININITNDKNILDDI